MPYLPQLTGGGNPGGERWWLLTNSLHRGISPLESASQLEGVFPSPALCQGRGTGGCLSASGPESRGRVQHFSGLPGPGSVTDILMSHKWVESGVLGSGL